MYAVVGCSDCGGYWLVADPADQQTARCQSCGTRHRMDRLKQFHTADDRAAAVAARARLVAADQDGDRSVATETAFAAGDDATPVENDRYLEAHGVDPDAVETAGDVSASGSRSREQILRDAVQANDDREAILDAAAADGLPRSTASDLLDRLVRHGEATVSAGQYRLL